MPREKDLKRLVRARMKKTGEAYTAARAQILEKPRRKAQRPAGTAPRLTTAAAPTANDLAELAGMSDAAITKFTAKGPSKTSVSLAHTKLPDRETADRLKQYWAERLDALAEITRSG